MKSAARALLSKFGSSKAATLGWRDMWAMVTIKKSDGGIESSKNVPLVPYKALGEEYSRSTEFHSWGAPVSLNVNVPLASPAESECPAWKGDERRRAFCNHIEGYGSVCSCSDPSPLYFPRPLSPVSLHE